MINRSKSTKNDMFKSISESLDKNKFKMSKDGRDSIVNVDLNLMKKVNQLN